MQCNVNQRTCQIEYKPIFVKFHANKEQLEKLKMQLNTVGVASVNENAYQQSLGDTSSSADEQSIM